MKGFYFSFARGKKEGGRQRLFSFFRHTMGCGASTEEESPFVTHAEDILVAINKRDVEDLKKRVVVDSVMFKCSHPDMPKETQGKKSGFDGLNDAWGKFFGEYSNAEFVFDDFDIKGKHGVKFVLTIRLHNGSGNEVDDPDLQFSNVMTFKDFKLISWQIGTAKTSTDC